MLDILAVGAHPDDIEIFMGGAVAAFRSQGLSVGILDLTRGEAGTYGDREIREAELREAARLLDVSIREVLDLPDGGVRDTGDARLAVIRVLRAHRPELVFTFSRHPMRHPDHQAAGNLVRACCFLAGLEKIDTGQAPFRPSAVLEFPELVFDGEPDFVMDITPFWETKVAAIRAYGSQVTAEAENDANTKTFIRSNRFWEILEARAVTAGARIGTRYGEPFFSLIPPRIDDILAAFRKPGLR